MTITLAIPEETAKALMALALITGRDVAEIAAIELEGTLSLSAREPHELLGLALDVYCDNPISRAAAGDRFQRYCQFNGIDMPEYEIDAALAEANREGEPGFGSLLAQAGRILSFPPPSLLGDG